MVGLGVNVDVREFDPGITELNFVSGLIEILYVKIMPKIIFPI